MTLTHITPVYGCVIKSKDLFYHFHPYRKKDEKGPPSLIEQLDEDVAMFCHNFALMSQSRHDLSNTYRKHYQKFIDNLVANFPNHPLFGKVYRVPHDQADLADEKDEFGLLVVGVTCPAIIPFKLNASVVIPQSIKSTYDSLNLLRLNIPGLEQQPELLMVGDDCDCCT